MWPGGGAPILPDSAATERMSPVITRLYVDNYKCLQSLDLELGPVCILLGRNGSGKSAVFEILHALQMIICHDAPPIDYFDDLTRTRWDTRREQRVELAVAAPSTGEPAGYTYRLRIGHEGFRGPRVLEETLTLGKTTLFRFEQGDMQLYRDDGGEGPTFPGDPRRSGLARVVPDHTNQKLSGFKDWLSGLLIARPNPAAISGRAPGEDTRLEPDLSNFASWYRRLAQDSPRLVYEALSDVAGIVPGFEDVSIQVDAQRVGWLRARFETPGAPAYTLDFERLSDGQRVLIALHLLLARHAATRHPLALDEPDNYLALAEIQPLLMRALDTALDGDGGQLLVISHHPECLNPLAPEHGIVFFRDGGGPTRVKPFTADEALPAAELIARGVGDV